MMRAFDRRSFLRMVTLAGSILLIYSISSAQAAYFPKGRGNEFMNAYYSHELAILGEKSLLELSKNVTAESYRFLWLRTFNQPIAVRLDVNPDGTAVVTVKAADGKGGFPSTSKILVTDTSMAITAQQARTFLAQVEERNYWQLPSSVKNDQRGTDGSEWIIEGVRGGKYHVVSRWSPNDKEQSKRDVFSLGSTLAFGIAKIKIPAKDIY